MSAILEPENTWQIIPASQLAGVQDQKVLIVGQLLAAGTATGGELQTGLTDNTSQNNAVFGRTSHTAGMLRAFKTENEIVRKLTLGEVTKDTLTSKYFSILVVKRV